MNYRDVFFDISPRQSGKTTRLVESVVEHLLSDELNTADIVCFNAYQAGHVYQRVRDRISELHPQYNINGLHSYSDSVTVLERVKHNHISNEHNMIFFDESDFIRHKFLYDRCYYNTTDYNRSTIIYHNTVNDIPFDGEYINRLSRELRDDINDDIINDMRGYTTCRGIEPAGHIDYNTNNYERYDNDNMTLDDEGEDHIRRDNISNTMFQTEFVYLDDTNEDDYPDLDDSNDDEYYLERVGIK